MHNKYSRTCIKMKFILEQNTCCPWHDAQNTCFYVSLYMYSIRHYYSKLICAKSLGIAMLSFSDNIETLHTVFIGSIS